MSQNGCAAGDSDSNEDQFSRASLLTISLHLHSNLIRITVGLSRAITSWQHSHRNTLIKHSQLISSAHIDDKNKNNFRFASTNQSQTNFFSLPYRFYFFFPFEFSFPFFFNTRNRFSHTQ
jgi:hypothetical protein